MILMLFWIKVITKRFLALLKTSPITIIWAMIIVAAFLFAIVNNHIDVKLDSRTMVLALAFFILASLINSLKNYDVMPVLTLYSKSNYRNKAICTRFFIKQAVKNNMLLLIFSVFAYNSLTDKKYFIIMPGLNIVIIFCLFGIMYAKNSYVNRKLTKTFTRRLNINPVTKSALYDFLNPNFIIAAIVCMALSLIVFIEFTQDINQLNEMLYQRVFFILISIAFFIGFAGIIDSIPKINWKFQAIIAPNDYKYHIKRTLLFLAGAYGWLFAIFIFVGGIIDIMLLLKYLYCMVILLLVTMNIAFTISHMIVKAIILSLIAALILWGSTFSAVFLPVLAIPFIITLIKARNEYREWSIS